MCIRDRYKPKRQKLMTIPCTAQTDKKLKYVRDADDFLIAVKGNREDCQWIKSKLAEFIGDTLKMEPVSYTHLDVYKRQGRY